MSPSQRSKKKQTEQRQSAKEITITKASTTKKRIPLRITDTTLRDAHQSLWATRLRSSEIIEIIDVIDSAGYYSLEVWGGATFDACLRFLRENPWERLRQIKARAKKTPLQMLLRGQNIVGYKNYPDDLLDRFIELACQKGFDFFLIFDANNHTRKLARAKITDKRGGAHAQGTLCYTVSPVHTIEEYVRIAREQVQMGVDSLAIKDMAGILSPLAAERLVRALIEALDVPIQIHSHATSGMGTSAYFSGVTAGAGAVDCAISVLAGFNSQPPVETILAIFQETEYHANLDIEALRKIRRYFEGLAAKKAFRYCPQNPIDPEILVHHIPGGMISNLCSQLEQQGALDKLKEVLEEVPRTRADLGYPPLVTPTSQIIGVQSVLNVLSGERYSMVTEETKDYVRGKYGRPPAPISAEIRKKILGDEEPIHCRPADLLEPILPKATRDVDPALIKSEEDIISYCLFPEPAVEYFKWRALPPHERPPIPADLEEQKRQEPQPPPPPTPPHPFLAPQDYREIHSLLEKVHALGLAELTIKRGDMAFTLRSTESVATTESPPQASSPSPGAVKPPSPEETKQPPAQPVSAAATEPDPTDSAPPGDTIDSPLNGTFYISPAPDKPPFVEEGNEVKAGTHVCTVEAMKLFNPIKAPCDCRIVKLLVKHGAAVTKGQPLIQIEPIGGK
ncbi:MAG: pyruvate carboxylase subunit B [Kiritimatiellia bacterium]